MWISCPFKWYLRYVEKIKITSGNQYTIFGSAIHSVLQTYLDEFYKRGKERAELLDLNRILLYEMCDELELTLKKNKNADVRYCKLEPPCSVDELVTFYENGILLIDYFVQNIDTYFSKDSKLLGIEVELDNEITEDIRFSGFIDLIIKKPNGRIKLIDFKTSESGWSSYKKNDKIVMAQLLLYKKLYAEKFGVSINKIDVAYLILNRKEMTIESLPVPSGNLSIQESENLLTEFINSLDNESYPKIPVDCKFCDYNNFPSLCDKNGEV